MTTTESVDAVLTAKNSEIAMWKKTHVDSTSEHAATIEKLKADHAAALSSGNATLAAITAERDALKAENAAIAARVAKETTA